MKKDKIRKFLPSIIAMDLTMYNCSHIETGFLSDNAQASVRIEAINDLSPGGISFARMIVSRPVKEGIMEFSVRIPIEEGQRLISYCDNKIKKYQYHMRHEDADVYINRYTLGVVTIDVDGDINTIPEYCGKEITDELKYHELYLSGMREELRSARKKSDKTIKK